jgi:hypothetical protein
MILALRETNVLSRATMPVVRTQEDDGSHIEGPQYALDKGYTGCSHCAQEGMHVGLNRLTRSRAAPVRWHLCFAA